MKIIEYQDFNNMRLRSNTGAKESNTALETVAATLLFLVPALMLFLLAK